MTRGEREPADDRDQQEQSDGTSENTPSGGTDGTRPIGGSGTHVPGQNQGRRLDGGTTDGHNPDDGGISRRLFVLGAAATGAIGSLSGCQTSESPDETGGDGQTNTTTARTDFVGSLALGADAVVVGDSLDLQGSDLPANADLDVVWQSWTGQWETIQKLEVVGPGFSEVTETVATVTTDGAGEFTQSIEIPEDYGGDHRIDVVDGSGEVLARSTVALNESVELRSDTVPVGSHFTLVAHGIGVGPYQSLRQVTWDNAFTGEVTAVTTNGRAEVQIPAHGPPGEHVIKVGGGSHGGVFYLNWQQSPYSVPFDDSWVVEVTEPDGEPERLRGDAVTPGTVTDLIGEDVLLGQYADLHEQLRSASGDAGLSIEPTAGHVESEVTVTGSGFGGGESVDLRWYTQRGNRVTAAGFQPEQFSLKTVQAGGNGSFETTVTIPDDLGNAHPIAAVVGGDPVAADTFVIQPSIVGMDPMEGPAGTDFEVHVKGVGWTEYDNTYTCVYDNAYHGYGCGFNTEGDVQLQLTAAGEPGYHTVTLYPTLYEGDMADPNLYSKPILTAGRDHPRAGLPVLQFLFRVTE